MASQRSVQSAAARLEEISHLEVPNKYAGRIKFFRSEWQNITSNRAILSWVSGYSIPFIKKPYQKRAPKNANISKKEFNNLNCAILKLEAIGAICKCKHQRGEFLSPYFLVPKSDGGFRFVLNLRRLNKYIVAPHFKLEDYRSVKNLITKDSYMACIDLKDAYFVISISKKHRKFLRFKFNNTLFEFCCMPFGLCIAPFVFTKLLKPVNFKLRSLGFESVNYLDDYFLLGRSKGECSLNVIESVNLLYKLGFIINFKKSSLVPMNECKFLGFIWNSVDLSVRPTEDKINKARLRINKILLKPQIKIRKFAELIGILNSLCFAFKYSRLYLKQLEREKCIAVQNNGGNYNARLKISEKAHKDLKWWLKELPGSCQYIGAIEYKLEIFSDASNTGWGIFCNKERCNGFWNNIESTFHINYLEILAAFNGLKCFAKHLQNCYILLRIDNITAISLINRMGSVKYSSLNFITKKIWQWCEARNIYVFASYINTHQNIEADRESRSLKIETEYSLNIKAFQKIVSNFGLPQIDLFASSLNAKCKTFVSWKRDPNAFKVDAFTLKWSEFFFYAFPPFCILGKVITKIIAEGAEGILVVPFWPTQNWYPKFFKLLVCKPLFFQPEIDLLLDPFRKSHPIWDRLTLVAGKLSGNHIKEEA